MRSIVISLALLISLILGAGGAGAEASGQFAFPGLRAPDESSVNGLRFSLLYGQNKSMKGLDLGFVSMSESTDLTGVAFVFGVHRLTGAMKSGAAFSLINLHSGNDSGLNAAFINKVNNAENALGFGLVNIADGTTMMDIGGFNMAKKSSVQIGFVNVAKEIEGVQIGIMNIAENGFLPVFPFFNFPKRD